MTFEKSDNALLFWLTIYDFFLKYNRTVVFDQSEIGNEHAANFREKCTVYFRSIEVEKKFRFGGVKMAKSA